MDGRTQRAWTKLQAELKGTKGRDMNGLPTLALPMRQPYAWAIVQGLRYRHQFSCRHASRLDDKVHRVAIYAIREMSKHGYEDCRREIERHTGEDCPLPNMLPRGCIIGHAEIATVDATTGGIVFADPQPCEPVPAVWRPSLRWLASRTASPPPAKWMLQPRQLDMLDWIEAQDRPQKRAGEAVAVV